MNRIMRIVPRSLHGLLALMAVAAASGCDDPVEPVEMDARQVLTTLYKETRGSRWTSSDNWVTDAPLDTWFGVTTDSGGNVTGLRLPGNFLNGPIPPELGMLESLEHLDFGTYYAYSNSLTGSIPPELGNLRNLEYLNLTLSGVTGSLPPELGSLRNLKVLRLALNRLTGSLPPELGNLQNLEELILYSNGLTGSIPSELGNLRHLVRMFLGSNELTGPIPPEFGNLQNIESLSIAGARLLTGSIPPELGSLQNLDFLNLEDNASMSGRLPLELIGVPLEVFRWNGTDMCAPRDDAFREWLASIRYHQGGRNCPG
ncbi:MAG: hypothetical protein OXQ94_15280 [Gemmatimonadota bacterium]|nr:hypothetical protein [Gemmatimonadota bacterium]MDE2873039.1 hypothetical protein [Gemmatimonadota bacterium]